MKTRRFLRSKQKQKNFGDWVVDPEGIELKNRFLMRNDVHRFWDHLRDVTLTLQVR